MGQNTKTKVSFEVDLDENRVPDKIEWTASDANIENKDTRAVSVHVWDNDELCLLSLDLWTKEMSVDEMKQFLLESIYSSAKAYERATGDEKTAEKIQNMCEVMRVEMTKKS